MLNQCNFIGHLGADPEIRYAASGDAVCSFSVAVSEKWKDKNGQQQESTEWVRCVAWRKLGEVCGEWLKKGQLVFVSGKMKTRKWQDKEGVDRYTTEIQIEQMRMLGGKDRGSSESVAPRENAPRQSAPRQQPGEAPRAARAASHDFDDMDDDIPF